MINKDTCCGCHACAEICPNDAITWKQDEKGFGYPLINGNCVGCGLCEKVCPMEQNTRDSQSYEQTIYGAYSRERKKSTSGGISYELAKYTVESQGVACGVILNEDFTAQHSFIYSTAEIDAIRDSKYIQSELVGVFPKIAELLKTNKMVLFTGTPCQTAALKNYLKIKKINTSSLILCDLVCHGVASPQIFKDYIALCQKNTASKIVGHQFRDKSFGWHKPRDCNKFENGDEDNYSYESQLFTRIYIDDLCQRKSCTHCPFASTTRGSDITLGDFWGIEKIKPEFDDNKGVSLVICNTKKGKQAFDAIKSDLTVMEFTMEDALQKQPHLQKPIQYGEKYEQFWSTYRKSGFEGVVRKMYQYGFKYDVIRICKNILRPLKNKLKRYS